MKSPLSYLSKPALTSLLTLALWSAWVALPAYTQEPANTNITPGASQLEPGEVPAGLPADAWSQIMDAIRRDRYHIKPNLPEQGAGYRAANHSQGLQATFSPTGPVVEPMATAASPQDTPRLPGNGACD